MPEIYKSPAGKAAVEALYERVLEHWPLPFERILIPTGQGNTFVLGCGPRSGWPVVLFHGSGTNSSAWIRDVAMWARQYRVYAVDMIGEPGFSAPARPALSSEAYAEWLDEVWSGLGLTQASLAGISLGGWLALDYAIRRPANVASVTLVSPSGVGGQNTGTLLRVALLRLFGRWGRRRSFELVAGKTSIPATLSERIVTVFRHFKPRMERIPIRSDAELAALRIPLQVILGAQDALLHSAETRDRLERLVPGARVIWLDNQGHIVPPQTEVIASFLDSVSKASQQFEERPVAS